MSEGEQDELPPLATRLPPGTAPAWPVAPLPNSHPPHAALPHRPGILSAVGVISIIVACLSLLASLVGGCQTGVAYMTAKVSSTMRSSSMATATVTTPSGGTTSVSSATPSSPTATDPATQPVGTNPLTPTEIAGAVQRAQSAAGNKLTPAQLNALTTALQDPNQDLVSPGTAWSPVRLAQVQPDGSAYVYFSGGIIMLDAQGQVTNNTPMNAMMPNINLSTNTCLLAGLDAVLNILLAVFLFIAAIVVIRNGGSGRRLHLIYALIKVPLAIAGGLALAKVISEFYGGMASASGAGAGAAQALFVTYAIMICGMGLIYPVSLLIAMNTPGVRKFYKAAN